MQNFKPYYAVIFTSTLSKDTKGYIEMAQKMEDLAKQQEGFLGIDSAREDISITVSYWESLDAIKTWKQNSEHLIAQQKGRNNGIVGIIQEYVKLSANTSLIYLNGNPFAAQQECISITSLPAFTIGSAFAKLSAIFKVGTL